MPGIHLRNLTPEEKVRRTEILAQRAEEDAAAARGAARPISEYHEDMGVVLWWKFPITEPPYVGSPLDLGEPVVITVHSFGREHTELKTMVGGWPGYHTHFTSIPTPKEPK